MCFLSLCLSFVVDAVLLTAFVFLFYGFWCASFCVVCFCWCCCWLLLLYKCLFVFIVLRVCFLMLLTLCIVSRFFDSIVSFVCLICWMCCCWWCFCCFCLGPFCVIRLLVCVFVFCIVCCCCFLMMLVLMFSW